MPEDSEFLFHAECEECGSSDANSVYSDGHTHCFACGKTTQPDKKQPPPTTTRRESTVSELVHDVDTSGITKRLIRSTTCEKFGYGYGEYKGQKVHVAPYRDNRNQLVAQKLRFKDKSFVFIGEPKKAGLFGQHLWKDGGKKVVVTEGEIDALSMSQVQDNKWPVVSVGNGAAGAAKSVRKSLEWLEQYEQVVFMFDMDEPGQEAARECAALLSPGKAHIAQLPLKDANEMLKAGRTKELIEAMWNAKVYRPDGIVSISDIRTRLVEKPQPGLSYPWETMTRLTYGIRKRELVAIGAGTGSGKSTLMKQIMAHLMFEHGQRVGGLFLEESVPNTAREMMSISAGKLFHLPNSKYTQEEWDAAYNKLVDSDRVHLFDHYGTAEWDTVRSRIRYMAAGLGCEYIFLDHVTMLAYGDEDERKELDRIMAGLTQLKEELNINIHFVSHLTSPDKAPHEEGGRVTLKQFRGSRAIGQCCSFAIGLERDQQDPGSPTTVRVLKDRFSGRALGQTFGLSYDASTGLLSECPLTRESGPATGNDFDSGGEY